MKPLRKIFLGVWTAALIALFLYLALSNRPQGVRVNIILQLKQGEFNVYRFVPEDAKFAKHPLAVVVFWSGDGGFLVWEDRVGRFLQSSGYDVLGVDSALYARTDYTLETLQADANTIAQSALAHYGNKPPPLIMSGWSMGAAQVVAVAGGPHPPAGLIGLVVISPEDRGRYGLRLADKMDITPTGPGTFALKDFGPHLTKIRIAQWNANLDLFGSKTWLASLSGPSKSYDFPYGLHDYNGASDQFLKLLDESFRWVLSPDPLTSNKNVENKG